MVVPCQLPTLQAHYLFGRDSLERIARIDDELGLIRDLRIIEGGNGGGGGRP